MKPSTPMDEQFTDLTDPKLEAPSLAAAAWYDAEALEIFLRTSVRAKVDEFRLKENDLRTLFARLTPLESRALYKRLAGPVIMDRVATAFSRLVVDRRQRLLAFIADARRREAIEQAARGVPDVEVP